MKKTSLEISPKLSAILKKYPELAKLGDQRWRLSNLYAIKDPYGRKIIFSPNWAQQELLDNLHNCNIVLKARQLGITTLFCIYLLDQVLWNDNTQAGIIAHTLDDAQNIFVDKLKFAFDNLHPAIRPLFRAVGDSAKELSFSHGSVIRVGTSLRSSTLQYLHISEFGKICAKYPEKAREVVTGALNTIHPGQFVVIESTAEGREGAYYEMCEAAFKHKKEGENFGDMDFYPFFFPWHLHPTYILNEPQQISQDNKEYFAKLHLEGITLTDPQKWWYIKKQSIQGEDMLREFPATNEEAFASSQVGNWYASQIKDLYANEKVTVLSYDPAIPVHTAWDLGQADAMAIWFFQINKAGEIMVIDYFERKDTPLTLVVQMLTQKGYTYGTHIWPHDAKARDRAGITFEMQAREFFITGVILEQHGLLDGINLVRTTIPKMWFDGKRCQKGLQALTNYKKRWNTQIGGFTSHPVHDEASHGSDAMRYLCAGLKKITPNADAKEDYEAMKKYWGEG